MESWRRVTTIFTITISMILTLNLFHLLWPLYYPLSTLLLYTTFSIINTTLYTTLPIMNPTSLHYLLHHHTYSPTFLHFHDHISTPLKQPLLYAHSPSWIVPFYIASIVYIHQHIKYTPTRKPIRTHTHILLNCQYCWQSTTFVCMFLNNNVYLIWYWFYNLLYNTLIYGQIFMFVWPNEKHEIINNL